MLEDSEGVSLFESYLQEYKQGNILECLLAMKGFRDFGLKASQSANSSAASSTTGPLTNTNMDTETVQRR